MNIKVITSLAYPGDDPMLPVYEKVLAGKLQWARRHGYTVQVQRQVLKTGRHPSWDKINLVLYGLAEGYDWIFWTDADAAVVNQDVKLEGLTDDDYDVIVGSDWNGLNNGQMLVRNTPTALDFFNAVLALPPAAAHTAREQDAMKTVIRGKHPVRVFVTSPHTMNTEPNKYRPGDFIVHAAGWRREQLKRFV